MNAILARWSCALAIATVLGASPLWAQTSGADVAPAHDPPDTLYTTGDDQEIDESRKRGLPLVPAYRAFLPVSVDVTSHMPPAGRQGKLSSCTAWAVAYAARSYYI
jgi:hypothetical protein